MSGKIKIRCRSCTYDPTKRIKTEGHLRNIASLKEICRLEDFFLRYAIFLYRCLEPNQTKNIIIIFYNKKYFEIGIQQRVYLPLNVFHKLEICPFRLNFFDRARCKFVDQFAKDNAILENVFIISWWEFLTEYIFDPSEDFCLLFFVTSL